MWQSFPGKRIRVALGFKFGSGNRAGYTKVLLQFDNPRRPSQAAMYWADNKAKWRHGSLRFGALEPARPHKSTRC
jgi:hypothetical protein